MGEEESEFQFQQLEGEFVEKFLKAINHLHDGGLVKITPSNCCLPPEFMKHADRIRRFEVRPDDVWILTYPKCGTTWTQEMVWLLMNYLDFETAKKVHQMERSPFFEFGCLGRGELHRLDTLKMVQELKSPRCIKSHLPLQLLPREIFTVKPKVIYVAREAKDVAVSYYHHYRLLSGYTGSPEDFTEAFMAGIVGFGCIWDHILDFWKLRHESHILFNTYEEMKKDLPKVVKRTAKFLDRDLSSEQLKRLCEHLSFDAMKNNPMVSPGNGILKDSSKDPDVNGEIQPFIRKGKIGGYKSDLTPELVEKMDKWSKEKLKGTNYPIIF